MVAVVGAVLVASFAVTGSALATTGHTFAGAFGAAGSDPGQFTPGGPSGTAVDPTSGDVLVADPGHVGGDGVTPEPRIERFAADGTYVSSIAIDGAAYGQVGGVAVDATGAVYVSAFDNAAQVGTVVKYSVAGTFVHAVSTGVSGTALTAGGPVAVDPSDGTVYATGTGSGVPVIDRFDGATGAFISSFDGTDGGGEFFCPSGLAVDGSSRVYVIDQACFGAGFVNRYSATGTFGATLDSVGSSAAVVAADPVSDEVLVGMYPFSGAQPLVQAYAAGGVSLGQTFGRPQIASFGGLAVNGISGAVYVTDNAGTTVQHYTTFEGPTVTTTAASSVDTVSATLNGTIDPGGVSSTYRFEYGQDASYGSQTTESDPLTGSSAVAATGPVSGLLPNTTYHFRIVGTNADGSITGDDQTVTTDPAPPTLDGSPAYASVIMTTGATLNGTLNPNSSPTTYHFEYGTDTTYGSSTTSTDAGAGSADQSVTAELTGLTAGTTYHFRLVADNGTGGVQHGADTTFSTAPGTPVSATDVSVFGATLHGIINPHGALATYRFEYGTTTNYGRITPEADGGSGNAELAVSEATGRLIPNTTYHVRLVATINGQSTASDDVTFTTGAMPEAVATDPTGVTTTQATLGGTVSTYGKDGTYRFFVNAINGAYTTTTDAQPVPAGDGAHDVSAVLSGLPAGESFRVVLSVTSNGGTTASDQVVFSTAPVQVPPGPPPISPQTAYGCSAPALNAYNQHPKPGDIITVTGRDLGVGGTVALGDTSIPPTSWSASGFSIEIPNAAAGTLPLTVNCGQASNTIAIAIYRAPDNRFTITKATVKGITASLTLKLPGVGKVKTSAAHTAKRTTTITKTGTRTIKVALTKAGKKTLNKAKHHRLKVTIRVNYTPAGGTAAAHTKTVTFKTASKR
jgi:hypothetical protein